MIEGRQGRVKKRVICDCMRGNVILVKAVLPVVQHMTYPLLAHDLRELKLNLLAGIQFAVRHIEYDALAPKLSGERLRARDIFLTELRRVFSGRNSPFTRR